MIFRYTNNINFTHFANAVNQFKDIQKYKTACYYGSLQFVCNLYFVPCNLTTGTPKPICYNGCDNFSSTCDEQFSVIKDAATLVMVPVIENCENALNHLKGYGYSYLSSDFKDDCVSLPGILSFDCRVATCVI